MINALVVDDEIMARESMSIMLSKFEDVSLAGTAESAEEARDYLKKHTVDVIFLDVEMPGLSGLEFLATSSELPQIVLVTNNPQHALEAFEYDVLDFIAKPITFKRLTLSVNRLRTKMRESPVEDFFFVRSEGKYVQIELEKLLFVETLDDYVVLNLEDGEKHIVHSTLSQMEERLPPASFMKVHRSYIINLGKIKDLDDTTAVVDRKVIPVSRANRKALRERLGL